MHWTFGTFLEYMLVVFFWTVAIWMFIAVFADIFRRDMSGWTKAAWVLLIVIIPFLGALIYLIARPKLPEDEGAFGARRSGRHAAEPSAAAEIDKAARLLDQGKITNDEYEQLKHQALVG